MFKTFTVILSAIFLSLSQITLEAATTGWGKKDTVATYEEANWNEVYIQLAGLNLTASIPGYSYGSLQNNSISLSGKIENQGQYEIMTSFNPGFVPPKTLKEFVKLVKDANPSYIVNELDAKKIGGKYVVEMSPKNSDDAFWRFIATNDRLVKMVTTDKNAKRRLYFFESITIK